MRLIRWTQYNLGKTLLVIRITLQVIILSEVAMISKDPMVLLFESVAGDDKKFSTWKKTTTVILKLMTTLQTERDQRGTSNEWSEEHNQKLQRWKQQAKNEKTPWMIEQANKLN